MAVRAALFAAIAGLQIFGGLSSRKAAKEAADRQAALMELQAQQELRAAALAEEQVRQRRAKDLGAARAAFGVTGVAAEGTPQNVLAELVGIAEKEAALTKIRGIERATALRAGAALEQEKVPSLFDTFSGIGTSLLSQGLRFAQFRDVKRTIDKGSLPGGAGEFEMSGYQRRRGFGI